MRTLKNQVAIITGAGKGLGRAYALDMALRGAAVVVNNRRHPGETDEETSAWSTVECIRAAGGQAIASYHSVEDPEAGNAIVQLALKTFGRLDIIVTNAAVPQASAFHQTSPEDFRYIFEVGFFGTLHLLHAAWPILRQRRYGRIITTTSSAGRYGQHGLSAYGAAKAAVENLTRTLAAEGARHSIKVNAISPYAYSQMTASHMRDDIAALFTAEHVAPMVAWLASEACTLNGAIISAGAGRYRRAYCVETTSIAATPAELPEAVRRLASAPATAFSTSNAAFDALLVDAGLAPRR
ncbi:hypothetical protein ACG33_11400 [Steroidobacter denitrificans]|uniref:Ketoreductase domain-containing protein n=2 Tax=Steroidobacter denitrificans TaxID=465721 RepID=A0A127FB94_STEDE|nr:hypothetical protein ACG33_11400 [Steroidobacter denitrificans]